MKKLTSILLTTLFSTILIVGFANAHNIKELWEYTHAERAEIALEAGIIADLTDYKSYDNLDQNLAILNVLQGSQVEETFGGVKPIAGTTYNLAGSGVSSSGDSITLQSFTLPQNNTKIRDSQLSDTFYITLEPGNRTRQEIVSCTTVVQNANGTATLSSCIRGLSPLTPYTASSTLRFSHAGGSQVIFSNPPQLYEQFAIKDNIATIDALWTFNQHPQASSTLGTPTTSRQYVTKQYTDTVALQGAATATAEVAGIVREATITQIINSTNLGIYEPLFIHPKYASSTLDTATTSLVVTKTNGKINQLKLDLTEAFAFTKISVSGTTILASTTITELTATTATITNAIITNSLLVDGDIISQSSFSRLLSATTTDVSVSNTTDETTLMSVSIPANTLGTDNIIRARLYVGNLDLNNDDTVTFNFKYGNTTATSTVITNITATTVGINGFIEYILYSSGATNSQEINILIDLMKRVPKLTVDNLAVKIIEIGTATEDSTNDLNMIITSQFNDATEATAITITSYTVEVLSSN